MTQQILILVALIILSAIFSGSETALISLSMSKVNELATKKVTNSKILKKLKNDPHKLLITILIGNNVVNIGASAYATVLFTSLFESNAIGIVTGVMTFLILVFGEIVPKSFAHQHAVGFSLVMARPIQWLQFVLFPLVWVFDKIVHFSNFIFGGKKGKSVTEGEIVAMLKIGAKEGAIEHHERELIENVLEFNDIKVEQVMTPRVAIEALEEEMTLKQAIAFALKHSHSRLPVYRKDIDSIVGVISIKDLLRYSDQHSSKKKIKSLKLMSPVQVPLAKKINMLFKEFQRKHQHMSVVIDDHGGTAGIVTMEDLLEEIVGEIVDEFDVEEKPIEIMDPRTILTTGMAVIEDINDFFRIKMTANEHDSVNTIVNKHLGRFPRKGEIITLPTVKIKILEVGKNTIKKVQIKKRG